MSAIRRVYPTYSPVRRIARVVNIANQIGPRIIPNGIDRIVGKGGLLPPMNESECRAVILNKLRQNGRVYAFDFDADGEMKTVTKVATNAYAARGLKREAEILRVLAKKTPFRIPELLQHYSLEGGLILQTSAAPSGFKLRKKDDRLPNSVFAALARLRSSHSPKILPANEFPYWHKMSQKLPDSCLWDIARRISPSTQFSVVAAHNDLGSENVFSCKDAGRPQDYFIIDWEFFTDVAPELSDRVGVWLGRHHRQLKGRKRTKLIQLQQEFVSYFDSISANPEAAVFALVHLAYLGIDLAQMLLGGANHLGQDYDTS